jgi:hypothetical protein
MRLFDDADTTLPLKLLASQQFETGVLNLVYVPDEAPPEGGYEDAKQHLPDPE